MNWTVATGLLQTIVMAITAIIIYSQLNNLQQTIRADSLSRAVEDHDRLNEILLVHPELNSFLGSTNPYASWAPDEVPPVSG